VKDPKQSSMKVWTQPARTPTHLEEVSIQEEETQAEQSHILPGESRQDTTLAVPVQEKAPGGKKRKAEFLADSSKKKFVFNKRGKLKDDELIELARTNRNIFSWLKPSTMYQGG
jgi:hypothetical protein